MKVFLLASTKFDHGIFDFMREVGWDPEPDASHGDTLAEVAGRLCYKSWRPYDGTQGTNANVTKVREGNMPYVGNIIDSGHGSVLEHINFTFACMGISRVFTHELVRHRAGCAYSQESLRYCRLQDLTVVLPADPNITPAMKVDAVRAIEGLKRVIAKLDKEMIAPHKSFDVKKKLTSWLRRIAPIGISTNIMFTVNARALRHMICTRTSVHAEVEIREAFDIIAHKAKDRCPALFQDLYRVDNGEWVSNFTDYVCSNTECEYKGTVGGPLKAQCPVCNSLLLESFSRSRAKI